MNPRFLENNAKEWMEGQCRDIWSKFISEDHYREWCAMACDNTPDLEAWRAPLWLAHAVQTPQDEIRLQETPEQQENISESHHRPGLEACLRLDLEHTDKLIQRIYVKHESGCRLWLQDPESKEIEELYVLLAQGAKIPAGLHANDEDSTVAALLHQLVRSKLPAIRPIRRRRHLTPLDSEREKIIRQVIKDGFKGRRYCRDVDELGGKIPVRWREKGCPDTYVEAYMQGKPWRHYINNEKWRIAKSMRGYGSGSPITPK